MKIQIQAKIVLKSFRKFVPFQYKRSKSSILSSRSTILSSKSSILSSRSTILSSRSTILSSKSTKFSSKSNTLNKYYLVLNLGLNDSFAIIHKLFIKGLKEDHRVFNGHQSS